MVVMPNKKQSGGLKAVHRLSASEPRHQVGTLSEISSMRFKHLLGLLCAASISFGLATPTSAQQKTVKIGAIYPLSGNAASAGVHAKAAIETAVDIINN